MLIYAFFGSSPQLSIGSESTTAVMTAVTIAPLVADNPESYASLAALGAIVIFAATRLIQVSEFIRLYRFRSSELILALITTITVLLTDILVGVAVAISLSVIELFARVARPHDAILGTVPGLAGLHDIDDWEKATTIPGLVIYRYDAPLCFANGENFKKRSLEAIEAEATPVEWFVLNMEANVEIDITAIDILEELRRELAARGIIFGMARVKQDLYSQLKRAEFIKQIQPEYIFPTLPTAVAGFQQYKNQLRNED